MKAPSQIAYDLPFPDISKPNPLLDLADRRYIPPSKHSPFASRIVVRNDPSLFSSADASDAAKDGSKQEGEEEDDDFVAEKGDGGHEHAPVSRSADESSTSCTASRSSRVG